MPQAVEQALELIREDRPESIDRALSLLQNTVYSFSMKVCGHPQDAEDTMQDVLLKSVPHLAKFDNPRALTVWLYRVARNRWVRSRRGSQASRAKNLSLDELMPHSDELRELLNTGAPNPEAALLNSESAEHLKQAVLAVSPQYRMVLVLHDMEDLSTAEVAKIMGLRRGNGASSPSSSAFVRPPASGEAGKGPPGHRTDAARRLRGTEANALPPPVCGALRLHGRRHRRCYVRPNGPPFARLPAVPGIFLASLKNAVAQCRSYRPQCDSQRPDELRKQLLPQYQRAVAALGNTRAARR